MKRSFFSIVMLGALVVFTAVPSRAQSQGLGENDRYSIMRPEPWLPPKYQSPRGTQQRPVKPPRISEPQVRTTTVPPPLYVPQTGQVLPNIPTISGLGRPGAETSQDRAVRCAHQAGVYGSNAGNPSGYVNSCINQ
ncbi:MAG TPA: hypothetical protein VGM57_14500 [Pseudolabrys sp.]